MSAALYVEPAKDDDDDDRPPQDGMAFLRQVIKERKRVPQTTRVDITHHKKAKLADTEKSKHDEDGIKSRVKAPPPTGCCPSSTWQREQVAEFSEVRLGKLYITCEILEMNLTKFFLTIILTLSLYSGIFKTSLKLTMTTILFPVEIIFFSGHNNNNISCVR